MLGMQIPTNHIASFEPLIDAFVFPLDLFERDVAEQVFEAFPATKPWWLTVPERTPDSALYEAYDIFDPTTIIFPCFADNLVEVQRTSDRAAQLRALNPMINVYVEWGGLRRFFPLMESTYDMIALPHDVHRGFLLSRLIDRTSSDFHYSEFCSLDELRCAPPTSMHTAAPILSAVRGIDFHLRERRPKHLGTTLPSWEMNFPGETLDLAISNTKALKEAAKWV